MLWWSRVMGAVVVVVAYAVCCDPFVALGAAYASYQHGRVFGVAVWCGWDDSGDVAVDR